MSRNTEFAFNQQLARIAVGGYDDVQEIRRRQMDRVRDLIRKKREGIPFDRTEDEKEDEDRSRGEYADENLPEMLEEMVDNGTLTDEEKRYVDRMLSTAETAAEMENEYESVMRLVEGEPIYSEYLSNVYGIGTVLAARLFHKFGYCVGVKKVSQIWSYSGMAPGNDTLKSGEKAGFDPEAKKLAWLCADRMIMQGSNSMYKTEFYDPYKAEQVRRMNESGCRYCGESAFDHSKDGCEQFRRVAGGDAEFDNSMFDLPDGCPDNATPPWNDGHSDARARRYMAKKFLKHYLVIARDIKGLETPDEWVLEHGGHHKDEQSFENAMHARRVLSD